MIVRLHDGREVDSRSEDWRHECEARYILRLPSKEARRDMLAKIEEARGRAERERLERTMLAMWKSNQGSR